MYTKKWTRSNFLSIFSEIAPGSRILLSSPGFVYFFYSSTRICCILSAGPKLYVKPSSKSNRHIITNAIAHCVLAGTVNQNSKDKVLQVSGPSNKRQIDFMIVESSGHALCLLTEEIRPVLQRTVLLCCSESTSHNAQYLL